MGRVAAGSMAKLDIVRAGERKVLNLKVGELTNESGEVAAASGATETNAIGLAVESVDEATREQLGIEHGVQVTTVDGVAEDAGIQPGDIILRLNNAVIASIDDFQAAVAGLPKGKSVPVLVSRKGSSVFLALRVPD